MIPELRFPEFINDKQWKEDTIENILASESSSLALNKLELKKEGYPIYGADSIVGYIDNYQHKNKYISIVKDGSGVGRLKLCESKSSILGTLISLQSKDDNKYRLNWIYYLLNTIDFSSYIKGGGIPHIYYSDYKNEKILFPNPTEQQKIADCLSSLDKLITVHVYRLETLKTYKKGLMQNLFPQDGEKIPKLRFKEFVKDREWKKKSLGKVADIVTGNTPSTSETQYYNGGKLFVSPADINDFRYLKQTRTTLSDLGFSKTRKIKENSVLFVCIGSTIGKIAQNKVECATNQQINSLTCFENYSNDFLYSILEYHASKIAEMAGNHAVPIINKSTFSEIELNFPPTFQEQQKIAVTFSSLDELILEQANKIENLKLHKKGLMQGLFPKTKKRK